MERFTPRKGLEVPDVGKLLAQDTPQDAYNQKLRELYLTKQRLLETIQMLRSVGADIESFGEEGQKFGSYAAAAAGVMMMTDICRVCLEAAPGGVGFGSRYLFRRVDQIRDLVGDFYKMRGKKLGSREDALGGMQDETARKIVEVTGHVEEARRFLSKTKLVKESKAVSLVVDLAVKMSEDTALMMDSTALQTRIGQQTKGAAAMSRQAVLRVENQLSRVQSEIARLIEEHQKRRGPRHSNTRKIEGGTRISGPY